MARLLPGTIVLARYGLNIQDVADAMGVNRVSISNWFSGRCRAQPEMYTAVRALAGSQAEKELVAVVETRYDERRAALEALRA